MASNSASSSLPKWQLALVLGAPVALGLGYMYYRNCRNASTTGKSEDKASKKSKRHILENGDKQISIDGDSSGKTGKGAPAKLMPLEEANKYKTEGNKLFNNGKFDEAIAQYNVAIQLCPKENPEELATFYQNRAAAYEKLKKYSAVRADCTTALQLKPKYIKALVRRARAMESSNDLETALEDITAACILERFSNETTLSNADRVLKQLGKQHAQNHIQTKTPVMPSKHFISTYFMAFHCDPLINHTVAESELEENQFKGLEAVKKQEYDDVIPLCTEELNSLPPQDAGSLHEMKIRLLRGTFSLLLGLHENAIKDLSTVIESEKSSKELKVNALIKRASMHIQLEDPEKSFEDFKLAEKLDPRCSDIYHNRGQVNLIMERVDDAKLDFQKAVEFNPGLGVPFVQKCYADYRYAVAKKDLNLVNEAMNKFNEAIDKFPDCSECYTLYAQMLVDNQDFEKADAYFVQAAKKDPNNATILVYRGLLQLQWQNNFDKATEFMKDAIKLDDKCEFAYETLGTVEVQRGNLKDAIELFDKALSLGRTIMELTHIFSLRDAAKAQMVVSQRLGSEMAQAIEDFS